MKKVTLRLVLVLSLLVAIGMGTLQLQGLGYCQPHCPVPGKYCQADSECYAVCGCLGQCVSELITNCEVDPEDFELRPVMKVCVCES